ncbi:hypothetical protein BDV06DRAFT_49191 [Aspergillus oleicola]
MGSDQFSRYSSSPALLGSDDPSLTKESEELLLKFMRGSSQEALDTNIQSHDRHSIPTAPAVKPPSAKSRSKIPRGNVQIRPKRAPENPGPRTQQTTASPLARTKPSYLQRRRRSPSSSSDHDIRVMIRRSGRSRAEPTNYYKKLSIFDSESEEEVQVIEKVATPKSRSQSYAQHKGALSSGPPATTTERIRQRITSANSSILERELGRHLSTQYCANDTGEMRLIKTWKGASNDVVSLGWSPDGTKFAAGATAQCDEHMMAYNRKNNLLLGNLVTDELHELPDHWIERPGDRGSASHVVNDFRLFMSVTAVQFFEDALYTASYDHTVKKWDLSKGGSACCTQTLHHNSEVIVMAHSNFNQDLLATGARTIGYWNTKQAQYTALDLPRARSRKDIEFIPTSIAWGTNQATKDYLLAGMSEREDKIASHGLLAAFRFHESTITPEYFSPNSQNVFDVAWHPVLPIFATACTAGQQASRGIRSVVNLYEPLKLKSRVLEFECPALDMNEAKFCPFNNNYISATCTDGITYIWDLRNSGQFLHTLKHGEPLNQLDETIPREQADTGVNMQLWGSSYDQFFTGASDGMVKRWDILRAPEDVLVEDVASIKEGIMSGAFSPDQTNLLVGDVSGGLHLLSNSPFSPDKALTQSFIFRESPHDFEHGQETDPESGVTAARNLITSGQIERHPNYGPGQGPRYEGPFAAWARPEGTPLDRLASTPLEDKHKIQQLSGASPKWRVGLKPNQQTDVERHITLAIMRNQRRGGNKRRIQEPRIKTEPMNEIVDLCSDEEVSPKRRQPVSESSLPQANFNVVKAEVIDLTGDSDTESSYTAPESPITNDLTDDPEDDFWWPESGIINPNFSE